MKIGIISDSHDNVPALTAAGEMLEKEGAEALLHAGDIVAPFSGDVMNRFNGPIHVVFGNCDGERTYMREFLPEVADGPLELTLGGKRFLLIHDLAKLPDVTARRADYVVSGHTHKPLDEIRENVHYLNPGECGGWLSGKKTVMLLDTETDETRLLEVDA